MIIPHFNVVMLVRDRKTLTIQSIRSMYQNMQSVDSMASLTIVDDASQERVCDWIYEGRLLGSCFPVIRNDISSGTGAARNKGIEAARKRHGTDNLLYLSDNDVFFLPGWDTILLAAHEQFRGFKIIGGGCHPFMQPHDIPYLGISGGIRRMTSRDAVSGYSWLLDWETWDRFGKLSENGLGVRQSEDWEYCQRIRKAGYYVGSVVPEVVIHCGLFDTFGERPPGWELMARNQIPGVIYE